MIINYSQIVGSQIVAMREQQAVGKVADLVLQKSDLKIKAVLLDKTFFFNPQKVVTFGDIIEYDKNALIIQNSDQIVNLEEVVTVAKAVKSKSYGVRQKVFTKSKKIVGYVYDYSIESSNGMLYNLYVKYLLADRLIARSSILEFTGNSFIIEDDYQLAKNNTIDNLAEA